MEDTRDSEHECLPLPSTFRISKVDTWLLAPSADHNDSTNVRTRHSRRTASSTGTGSGDNSRRICAKVYLARRLESVSVPFTRAKEPGQTYQLSDYLHCPANRSLLRSRACRWASHLLAVPSETPQSPARQRLAAQAQSYLKTTVPKDCQCSVCSAATARRWRTRQSTPTGSLARQLGLPEMACTCRTLYWVRVAAPRCRGRARGPCARGCEPRWRYGAPAGDAATAAATACRYPVTASMLGSVCIVKRRGEGRDARWKRTEVRRYLSRWRKDRPG